jgi:hypothetical protein
MCEKHLLFVKNTYLFCAKKKNNMNFWHNNQEIEIMKQTTAVEWLVSVVQSCIAPNFIPKEIVEQAKEMEKQQIIDAVDGFPLHNRHLDGEQYYNETFREIEKL